MTKRDLYLNHAGTSWPKPQVVLKAVQDSMSVPPSDWAVPFIEAHNAIAKFFGMKQQEQILFTPGCTSAIAAGLGDVFIPKGKRVLTSRWEHHAIHRPLLKLAATGVPLDYIPTLAPTDSQKHPYSIDLDWLENELSQKDVGLIAMTAACNVTGELFPIEQVVRMAHKYDSMVMIDAAQVVGWLRLDLPKLGADLVAFGGHKGLQAPWGIGGLYVSERAQMECTTASCVIPAKGSENAQQSNKHAQATIRPSYCDVGSVDQFALAGLHAAVNFLDSLDLDESLAKARQQVQRIRESLEKVDRLTVIGFGKQGLPTIAIKAAGLHSARVSMHLAGYGVTVGSGIHCAPLAHETLGTQETGLVRISVGLCQSDEDIDEAINRLDQAFSDESLLDTKYGLIS